MRRLGIALGTGLIVASVLAACGASRLPAPTYVGQPTEALQKVEYPPPPARVEYVPASPNDDAVWIDGEWTWQGRHWGWKPGRWVVPPAGARYAPWTSVRDSMGLVYIAEGKWRDGKGQELPDPQPLAVGRPSAGAVTTPEGEEAPAGPNVPPKAPAGGPDASTDGSRPETPSGATLTGTEPKTQDAPDAGPATTDAGPAIDAAPPDAISPRMTTP